MQGASAQQGRSASARPPRHLHPSVPLCRLNLSIARKVKDSRSVWRTSWLRPFRRTTLRTLRAARRPQRVSPSGLALRAPERVAQPRRRTLSYSEKPCQTAVFPFCCLGQTSLLKHAFLVVVYCRAICIVHWGYSFRCERDRLSFECVLHPREHYSVGRRGAPRCRSCPTGVGWPSAPRAGSLVASPGLLCRVRTMGPRRCSINCGRCQDGKPSQKISATSVLWLSHVWRAQGFAMAAATRVVSRASADFPPHLSRHHARSRHVPRRCQQ